MKKRPALGGGLGACKREEYVEIEKERDHERKFIQVNAISVVGWILAALACLYIALELGRHWNTEEATVGSLKAHKLDIVDSMGKSRLSLSVGATDEPYLRMYSPDGKLRIVIDADSTVGSAITIYGDNEQGRFHISTMENGFTFLAMGSEQQFPLMLAVDKDGAASLIFHDKARKRRIVLQVDQKGDGSLVLLDKNEHVKYRFPAEVEKGHSK